MHYRLYKILRPIVVFLLKVIYRIEVVNSDNIPKDKPVILVGNHKHNYDFISLISGTKRVVHFLGKIELFKDWRRVVYRNMGIIPVDRSIHDKNALSTKFNFNRHNIRIADNYSFSILQKLAISFLVPALSKAISSKVSFPIFSAETIIPLPKIL